MSFSELLNCDWKASLTRRLAPLDVAKALETVDESSLGLKAAKELGVSSRPASIDSKRKAMDRSSAQARTHVRSGEGIGVGSGVQDSGGLPTNLAVSFLTHFLYYVHLPRSARHALARQYAL